MSTLLRKLKNRFERERGVPVSERLRKDATAAVRFVSHTTAAKLSLRECTKVGAWARTAGGKPHIENHGRIELGRHVLLTSTFSPVQLSTGQHGAIEVGSGTIVNFGTMIAAKKHVRIGNDVSIGPYCVISDETLEGSDFANLAGLPIEIGDGVWLAGRVTVLPGARIGKGSVITAGSIVSGDVPPGVIAGGNPARVLRTIGDAGAANTNDVARASRIEASESRSAPRLVADESMELPLSRVEAALATVTDLSDRRGVRTSERPSALRTRALLIADFTIDELAGQLEAAVDAPLLSAEVAPFGQVVPTLLGLREASSTPDVVVVWTRPESACPAFQRVLGFEAVDEAELLAEVDAHAKLIADSTEHVRCVLVPTFTVPSYNRGWGLMDARKGGATRALYAMNLRLMERLSDLPNVHVLNAQRWVESTGKSGASAKLWYMGKVPYHRDVFAEAVKDIKAALSAVSGAARKLVVVDLDDTMWGGIVGDAGWENLRLGGHDAQGESFVDFQRALKNLKRRGILLAIASKNEESVALEAIRKHGEMVLREDDFVAHRISWQDKAKSVAEIAAELNLGLQSVVFIDDNPVERARVREALPEVFVPEWPEDKLLYASTLASLRCFDVPALTQEDATRTEMYVAEKKRASMVRDVGSLDEWLRSLEVRVVASRLDAANAPRAAQLLNKTNQLNLRTRRLTQPELESWVDDPARDLWVIDVSDKCGDSGLTGIVSIEARGDTAHVADFLLSCRVMGRKIEELLVHLAAESARQRGLTKIEAELLPTAKNKPTLDFFRRSGFTEVTEHRFVHSIESGFPVPSAVTLTRR